MAITEATLLTRVKKRTRRDELAVLGDNSNADFTYYMNLAVRRLSQDSLSLRGTATGSLAASTDTISLPSDAIDGIGAIDALTLGNSTETRNDPEIDMITWEEYRSGAKSGFALRGKTLYVNPKQETNRNYVLDYRKFHGSSVTTLEFEDKYEECLVSLLCHYVYTDLELQRKLDAEAEYKRKLSEVVDDDQHPVVKSRQRC
jgi:hypothetical protein